MTGLAAKWGIGKPGGDAPLQEHIGWYVRQGYHVVSQTETAAQLVKSKRFSFVWALGWFLLFGIGLIVYLLYYAAKKDKAIYLTVQADGTVHAN